MPGRKIRVLAVITDLMFGGAENRILNIAKFIDRDCFDYSVATLYAPNEHLIERLGSMMPDFEAAGIPVTELGLTRPAADNIFGAVNRTLAIARAVRALCARIRRSKIDILDIHLANTMVPAVPAARMAGVPSAMTLYDPESFPTAGIKGRLYVGLLRSATKVFTDSAVRARQFAAATGRSPEAVAIIPNAVRLPSPSRTREEVLRMAGIPSDARVIAQIAGLQPGKGYETLLAAASDFLPLHPGTWLLCVGFPRSGTEYRDRLLRKAEAFRCADRVRFIHWQHNIADIWNAVDIHVHASHADSLPNAIIEGMSLGKPAVVTDVGGVSGLVLNNITGLVVPPRDAASLASAVHRILGDDALAARFGSAARERHRDICAPDVLVRDIERGFFELANRQGTSAQWAREGRGR